MKWARHLRKFFHIKHYRKYPHCEWKEDSDPMGLGTLNFNSVNLTGGSGSCGYESQVTFCTSGVLQCWKPHYTSWIQICIKCLKEPKRLFISDIFLFFFKSSVFLHLLNKTHSRTQSYSVSKAVYVQPRRQAPAQSSLVNGEGNLPCPTLSLHTLWRDTWCIVWWCTWHRNAAFYCSCHSRLKKHFTNTNKWNSVSITPGLSPLLILP